MLREVTRKDLPQPIVKGQAQRETCKSTRNWKTKDETEVGLVQLTTHLLSFALTMWPGAVEQRRLNHRLLSIL